MNPVSHIVPEACAVSLGAKTKALRLAAGWKRATLAERAGVTEASLKRFERTGQASLRLILCTAFALGRLGEFSALLEPPPVRSIDELEHLANRPKPRRGVR